MCWRPRDYYSIKKVELEQFVSWPFWVHTNIFSQEKSEPQERCEKQNYNPNLPTTYLLMVLFFFLQRNIQNEKNFEGIEKDLGSFRVEKGRDAESKTGEIGEEGSAIGFIALLIAMTKSY